MHTERGNDVAFVSAIGTPQHSSGPTPPFNSIGRICISWTRPELNIVKREKWSEADVDELPAEEPDVFERKSGELIDFANQGKFLDAVAKALSAFANSGGGSLILGVKDDGTPDGLPPLVGQTAMRDWVEQKIPDLLDYPLADFRVHTVIKSDPSRIPDSSEVIVIDVGDSAAAPHQSKRDKIYYRRVGGRSVPAPHFYLEQLRQRLTNPTLEFKLKKIEDADVYEHDDGLLLRVQLKFEIENVGRVAAYDWQLSVRTITNEKSILPNGLLMIILELYLRRKEKDYVLHPYHLAEPFCPDAKFIESQEFGCHLRPKAHTGEAVREEIEALLDGAEFAYQLATETSPGELISIPLSPVLDVDAIVDAAKKKCVGFFP